MHLPDGVLDTKIWATLDAVSAGTVAYAIRQTTKHSEEKMIPMMGVMAAFIFAAQLMNVPTPGGPPVHLVGAVLAAVLLGPWPATVVMAAVLAVQSFLMQDGGLLALGANIFNIGVIGTLGGYLIFLAVRKIFKGDRGIIAGTFAAAWLSTIVSTGAVALQMIVSGASPAELVLPVLGGLNLIVGAIEGLITATIIGFVLKVRRDMVYGAVHAS
ncbi:MAG: energy-coupling factor ABC transporter permease [Actinomycetota bacterium]